MASKGVTDRQRVAKAIVAAARTHAREVGERLQDRLAPALADGQSLPDLVGFQQVLGQYLEMRIAAIVAADEVHLKELDGDAEPRRRRDQAAAALSSTLVGIREALVGAFGRDSIREVVGLQGETASEPVVLLRQASRVLERLREPSFVPESRLPGIQVDLDVLAAQVQPALDELARAVQDVDLELRKTESTLLLKDAALAAFDAAVAGIGRILTGFDELAGFAEFAEKIRLTLPTRRRRNNGGDEELPPGPDGPDGPDGPPDTELPPTFAVPEPLTAEK